MTPLKASKVWRVSLWYRGVYLLTCTLANASAILVPPPGAAKAIEVAVKAEVALYNRIVYVFLQVVLLASAPTEYHRRFIYPYKQFQDLN